MHAFGVGALPSNTSESGVARLLDEHTSVDNARRADNSHAPSGTANTSARSGSVGIVGFAA
ncbi:hypothetical protein EUX98_g7703 [Antrodiella citrinella]|uniref:Uncharacterized protein n=1 Tax=Antrodiella citrinella TaxID=2447956 RepID=A0A4S4ML74_9APHY|nr:hypothetical protein EUX98_g7703 [Antrodiella citrinella]